MSTTSGPCERSKKRASTSLAKASGPEVDPACHPGATAVQSYRHSHYGKDRTGASIDAEWSAMFGPRGGSALRAGIWYEDSRRHLGRDWHRILVRGRPACPERDPVFHRFRQPDLLRGPANARWSQLPDSGRWRLLQRGRHRVRGQALSDLFRSTEFSIVANNVLDSPYLSAITENVAWLGASRTVSMTVTVSF